MLKDELPDDLVAFLQSGRSLKYDASACEIGVFELRALDEINEIDVTASGEGRESTCSFRALDLLKSCETYDPRGMLLYIPSLRKYGSYDGDGKELITFRGMSWSDFLADPPRYINAGWLADPEIAESTCSDTASDRIVEVCSAANGWEAQDLCAALEEKGIRAQIVGDYLGSAGGGLPLGEPIAPRVWTREGDAGRAREIIDERAEQIRRESGEPIEAEPEDDTSIAPDEEGESAGRAESRVGEEVTCRCQECGNTVTFPGWCRGHVETCPECGKYLDVPADAAILRSVEPAPTASRTSAQLWIEVIAILALAYVPYLFGAVSDYLGLRSAETRFAPRMLSLIINSLRVSLPVLVIMALSGDPWRRFGIVRPRWIADIVVACAILIVTRLVRYVVLSHLPLAMLISWHTASPAKPEGVAGFLLLLIAEGANGFSEELVMRGYLIARLERLLSSTWLAVVVTTALFASYHIYQGVTAMIGVAAVGLVFGISYCWCRRLWPLCIAHAILDILVRLWA